MREIRAKTTKKENREHAFNNVWVEGDLVVSRDKYYIHPRANAFQVNNELSKLIVLHEVIPETIGQYTGLTDKNGKKIFEGDILKGETYPYKYNNEFNYYAVVIWMKKQSSFGLEARKASGSNVFGNADGDIDFFECFESKDFEVVGNIYDNKELLED